MIKRIAIKDIKESAYNPRVRLIPGSKEYEQIKRSLQEYGLVEPPVVNEYNMTCVGGHQRLAVMRLMGYESVDCSVVYITDPEQEKKLCIGLNKIKGRWDDDKLEELLHDDDVSAYFTGFEDDVINGMLAGNSDFADDEVDPLEDGEDEEDGEQEEELREENVIIKIGNSQFKLTRAEYSEMLDSIRDMGYFDTQEIINEIQRRLIARD